MHRTCHSRHEAWKRLTKVYTLNEDTAQNQGQRAGWPSKGSAFGQRWFLVAFEPANGKARGKDADTPEVYLFVYLLPAVRQLHHFLAEFAQVQVVEWILLRGLSMDLLGLLQLCLHGGQQRLLQVQVTFYFLQIKGGGGVHTSESLPPLRATPKPLFILFTCLSVSGAEANSILRLTTELHTGSYH